MRALAVVVTTVTFTAACAHAGGRGGRLRPATVSPTRRLEAIHRAQVWMATDIPSMDLRIGPSGAGAFAPNQLVACDYVNRRLGGRSPKFLCAVAEHDEVKVKYGRDNGEVYAEVAATRLLWALGFGADRMYPVRVECHGCPANFRGPRRAGDLPVLVEPAAIERKMPGHVIETREGSGWAWPELDLVDESVGGAPRAHRDALRLLAALIQHTDSKPEQQRLMCPTPDPDGMTAGDICAKPFMMLDDVGQTFGHANRFNRDAAGSVNFDGWSRAAVWSDPERCVANITKSITGTLDHPVISEDGRKFLAGLLVQLSDRQLHDLFDVARFELRSHHPTDDWVEAFKRKRAEVLNQTCHN